MPKNGALLLLRLSCCRINIRNDPAADRCLHTICVSMASLNRHCCGHPAHSWHLRYFHSNVSLFSTPERPPLDKKGSVATMVWTVNDSRNVYGIRHWGVNFFDVGEQGNVIVRPNGREGAEVDLYQLTHTLRDNGLSLPLLVRFPDILTQRARRIVEGFTQAQAEYDYPAGYTLLYPIKVNQQEAVVKGIIADSSLPIGLEAGSKPELMAVLALAPQGATIVCNGYKDREFIHLALIGQKLGHRVFIVIEKESEVQLVIEEAQRLGVMPNVGLRVRLSSLASSRWADSGGDKAKFGLSAAQLIAVSERFIAAGLKQAVRLLHFHMGSQIANIADYRRGFREALRYYGELSTLGLPLDHLDVGGGLGVDYDGTQSRNDSSVNYSIGEYAETIISMVKDFCAEQAIPCPHVMSESGRALTAHHAVLVVNVTDVERANDSVPSVSSEELEQLATPVVKLYELATSTDILTATETYFRAGQYVSTVAEMYVDGAVSLREKALAEQCYAALCRRIYGALNTLQRSHRPVFDELGEKLADKYFCNFSVFQSLPDTWAIDQLLPIAPIHRLQEAPTRRAVLQDLTCDSDGRVTQYVDQQSIESTMPVHDVAVGEEYLLGVFLVGAYQEILGDMHNLFGDTDSVNVYVDASGAVRFGGVEVHDTIEDMLRYVHLQPDELMNRYRDKVWAASTLSGDERRHFLEALRTGLTHSSYLVV